MISPPPTRRVTDVEPWGDELPLVGRRADIAALRLSLDDALEGRGSTLFLTGEAGVGKSRLLAILAAEARARGMLVGAGRGFSVESGVPYGAFADALAEPLRSLDPSAITVLARGAESDLQAILPQLSTSGAPFRPAPGADGEGRARLLWNVAQFLTRLAARQPLLLLLDNAHWADASSLELLHFVARQVHGARLQIVLAYGADGTAENAVLHEVVRSLLGAHEATQRTISPLTAHDLTEMLVRVFALPRDHAETHAGDLYARTHGNAFFIEESLKALLASGHIRRDGARWLVEQAAPSHLPSSIRDAVLGRLDGLPPPARRLAEFVSLVDGPCALRLLERVSGLSAPELADAIDALVLRGFLREEQTNGAVRYELAHPILQSLVRGELSAARERVLHASIASALEAMHGLNADAHASEIARHLVRGDELGGDARALRFLAAAGRDALARRAHEEAARWLGEAAAVAERLKDEATLCLLLEQLGTARQRRGDSAGAIDAWKRALEYAHMAGNSEAVARLYYEIGREAARAGDAHQGLTYLAHAEAAAHAIDRPELAVQVRVARAKTLQALGRNDEAIQTALESLSHAEAVGEPALRARVHQSLLQLYAWTGPVDEARWHGARALALADESADHEIAWAAHWAMGMLAGLTGDERGVAHHQVEATRLAELLSSPLQLAMTAELTIEHASGIGQWSEALVLAERMIPVARAVAQHSLLPRLLVWTGLIVLARDDLERARALFEEAWRLSSAEQIADADATAGQQLGNVHNAILAHTGMGSYWLSRGAWQHALTYGERGLAIADRHGYVAWAIHRLIPLVIEAGLWLQAFDRVEELAVRLRTQSLQLEHRLGLAWAKAADALVARLKYHHPDAAARVLEAADDLDAVPFVFHAARLRRTAAQMLEADGDAAAAVRELRRAHEVFATLGAERELRETRSQLRSLGVRLPPRTAVQGAGELTGRELEIARAVAARLSNKEIGRQLDISSRTVSTHLSNIFGKLGVDSRGALADLIRDDPRFHQS